MAKKKESLDRNTLVYVAIAIIVVAAAAVIIWYRLGGPQGTAFSVFKQNYDAAPNVAIYANGYNGTALVSTIGCATAVIEATIGNVAHHRNASTIDFFVLNQTSCVYSPSGLGSNLTNYTTTSIYNCFNMSGSEPTVFVNYSMRNSTIVKPKYLYTSGDAQFLTACGIASELQN